jgi:hypothetical protein
MQSSDLNLDQCERLLKVVERQQAFLWRLLDRMRQTGFPHNDRLRRDVQQAFDATMGLRMALHYMVCDRMKRERDAKSRQSPTGNYELYRRKRKG